MSFSNCPESNIDDTVIENKTLTNDADEMNECSSPPTSSSSLFTNLATAVNPKNADTDKNERTTVVSGGDKEESSNQQQPSSTIANDERTDLESVQPNNLEPKQAIGQDARASLMQMDHSGHHRRDGQLMNSDDALLLPNTRPSNGQTVPQPHINECGATIQSEPQSHMEEPSTFTTAIATAAAKLKGRLTSHEEGDRQSLATETQQKQPFTSMMTNVHTHQQHEHSTSNPSPAPGAVTANWTHPDQIREETRPQAHSLERGCEGVTATSQTLSQDYCGASDAASEFPMTSARPSETSPLSKSEHIPNPNTSTTTTTRIKSANEGELSAARPKANANTVINRESKSKEDEHDEKSSMSMSTHMGESTQHAAAHETNIHKNAVKQDDEDDDQHQLLAEIESCITAPTMLHEYKSGSDPVLTKPTSPTLNPNNVDVSTTTTNDTVNTCTTGTGTNVNIIQHQGEDYGISNRSGDSTRSYSHSEGAGAKNTTTIPAVSGTTGSASAPPPPINNSTVINNGNSNSNEEQQLQQQQEQQQMKRKDRQSKTKRRFPANANTSPASSSSSPSATTLASNHNHSNQQSVLSFDSVNSSTIASPSHASSSSVDENQIQVLDDLLDLLLTKPADGKSGLGGVSVGIQNPNSHGRRRRHNATVNTAAGAGAIKSEADAVNVNVKQSECESPKEAAAATTTKTPAEGATRMVQNSDSILRDSNFGTETEEPNVSVNVNVKQDGDGEPKEKKAKGGSEPGDADEEPKPPNPGVNVNTNEEVVVVKSLEQKKPGEGDSDPVPVEVEVSESLCVRETTWVCTDASSAAGEIPGPSESDSKFDTKTVNREPSDQPSNLDSQSVPDILLSGTNCATPTLAEMDATGGETSAGSPVARQLKTYGEHNQVEVYLVSSRTPSPSTPTNQSSGSGTGSDQTTIMHPQSSSSDYDGAGGGGGSGTLESTGSDSHSHSTRCGSLTKASRTVHFSPVVSEISWRESYTDQGSEFSESSSDNQLDDDHLARTEVGDDDDDDDDDTDEDEYDVAAHDSKRIEKVRVHSSNITEPDKIWLRVTDQPAHGHGHAAHDAVDGDAGSGHSPDLEEKLEYDLELGGLRNKSPAQRPTVLLTMVPDLLSQCEEKVSSPTPTNATANASSTALSPAASASTSQHQQNTHALSGHVEGKIDGEKLVPQKEPRKGMSLSSPSAASSSSSKPPSKYASKNGYHEEDVIQTVPAPPQPQQILPSKFAASQSKKDKEKGRGSGSNGNNKKGTSGASASAGKNNGERKQNQLGSATFLGLRSESSSSKKSKEKVGTGPVGEKSPQPQQSQQSKEKESKPGFFQRLGKLRLSGSSNKKKRDKIHPKENIEPPNKAAKMAQSGTGTPTTTTIVVTLKPNAGAPTTTAAAGAPILKKNGVNYQQQHSPYSPPSSTSASPEDVSPTKDQAQREQEDACSEAFESILDEIAGIKAIQQRAQVKPAEGSGSRIRTFAERKQFMSNPDIDQSVNNSNESQSHSPGGKGIDLLDSKLTAFKEDTHRTRDQLSKSQPDLETIERMTTTTGRGVSPAASNKSKLTPAHSTPNTNTVGEGSSGSGSGSGSPLNTSTASNTNKKTEREWYKLLKSAAEKYYHGASGKSSKTSKSNPNLILTNTNAGNNGTGTPDKSMGLPPATSSKSKNQPKQQQPAHAYNRQYSNTGIVETDLDTGTSREMLDAELVILDVQQQQHHSNMKPYYSTSQSPTNTGTSNGATGSSNGNGTKAKSLTNLTTHGLKLSLVPGATSILDDDNHLNSTGTGYGGGAGGVGGGGMDDDERTKSLEFLLDDSPSKRNGGAYNYVAASYLPPENKLCQENRQLSEHELRIQRSLSKLNVPDWYLRHNQSSELHVPRGGTLPPASRASVSPGSGTSTTATKLLKRSEYGSAGGLAGGWAGLSAYRTPSLSSLQNSGSGRFSGSLNRNFVRGRPATMSASAARSSRESLLSPSSTASQSPSAYERSSFTYGMPFSLTRFGHGRLSSTSGASPASITPPSTPGLKLSTAKQPYLGWRSQERLNLLNGTTTTNGTSTGSGPKLSIYRPPAERLAAEVLTLRQQRGLSPSSIVRPTGADRPPLPPQRSEKTTLTSPKSPSIPNTSLPTEVPSIHDSIREVTNAINEFVSLGQEPPPKPTPKQKPNKKQQIVWMESSFVGRRPPENGIPNSNHQQSVTASPYQC